MNSLVGLKLKGMIASLGFIPFVPAGEYLHCELTSTKASFQNQPDNPFIIDINGGSRYLKVWSNSLHEVIEPLNWEADLLDDVIKFKSNLMIKKMALLYQ